MRNAIIHIAVGAAFLLGAASPVHAQAQKTEGKKLYCWDEGGRKVCGDALPASAAAAARTEISAKSGRTLDTVARAMTPEERIAADAAAKQARLAAEQRLQAQRRDLAMVDSYDTEADLRHAYADRADLLDATIKASVLGLQGLHQSLLALLNRASDDELAGKPVPPTTLAALRDQHAEQLKQERILAGQRADRAALDAELADSLQRYRNMKHAGPGAVPAAAPPAATPPTRH